MSNLFSSEGLLVVCGQPVRSRLPFYFLNMRCILIFMSLVNPAVFHDYEILRTFEAGIKLFGFEVKAIKLGKGNLSASHVVFRREEPFLVNFDLPPYQPKNTPAEYESTRSRKLLLHANEIKYLLGKVKEKGLTVVPLKVYNKGGFVKVSLGLARGLKKFEKREKIKKREFEREKERVLKRGQSRT